MATFFAEAVILSFLAGGILAAVAVFQIKNRKLVAVNSSSEKIQRP